MIEPFVVFVTFSTNFEGFSVIETTLNSAHFYVFIIEELINLTEPQ